MCEIREPGWITSLPSPLTPSRPWRAIDLHQATPIVFLSRPAPHTSRPPSPPTTQPAPDRGPSLAAGRSIHQRLHSLPLLPTVDHQRLLLRPKGRSVPSHTRFPDFRNPSFAFGIPKNFGKFPKTLGIPKFFGNSQKKLGTSLTLRRDLQATGHAAMDQAGTFPRHA